jgi:GMP synthase-like glutamine amidotransferase
VSAYDTYPEMISGLLRRNGWAGGIAVTAIVDGERLPPPGPDDALLLTGSPAGVYEELDWIEPLMAAVREWVAARRPVVGICFGHQLIAQALGGQVVRSTRGWGVGVHTYDAFADTSWGLPPRLSCIVSHQDQVIERPAAARRIGGSPFCPNGMLHYAQERVLTYQFHPEFSSDFARDLMGHRREIIGEDVADLATASFIQSTDRELIGELTVRFLSGSLQ